MNRGELYRVRRPAGDPKEARVFVVVSRQPSLDSRFSTAICAPVFTERHGLATQVDLGPAEGLKHECAAHCDALVSVPKAALTDYVGALDAEALARLDLALAIALGLA